VYSLNELSHLIKFCKGFKPAFSTNISLNFPVHRIALEYQRQWRFNVEQSSFYGAECFNNGCLIKVEANVDVCAQCQQLEYNMDLKMLIERCKSKDIHEKEINNKFLAFNQLSDRIDKKSKLINVLKFSSLNLLRNNISLWNRTSDYKRLMVLISQNDIPRVK
jgi:hypothetical protein